MLLSESVAGSHEISPWPRVQKISFRSWYVSGRTVRGSRIIARCGAYCARCRRHQCLRSNRVRHRNSCLRRHRFYSGHRLGGSRNISSVRKPHLLDRFSARFGASCLYVRFKTQDELNRDVQKLAIPKRSVKLDSGNVPVRAQHEGVIIADLPHSH